MGNGSRAGAWRAALLGEGSSGGGGANNSMSASLQVCKSAGGGRVVLLLARARRFTYSARSSRAREAFLGCTSHAADLQQRAEFGEDCRIFGGVVTDDWMMPFKPAVSWDCVTACLLH
jgi:hypothetical protein